jgi:hypothetical protein
MLPRCDPKGAVVKEQYVGDISDYRKYALLRALAAGGENRIGVCWMLTPSDGRNDGSKLAYLSQPEKHRRHDPELFDILAHAAAAPDRRRLRTIEASDTLPCGRYFNAPLNDNAGERQVYMASCLAEFAEVDLVFFDPDNGLEVPSVQMGRKGSSKYLYLEEVRAFYENGNSVLIYQHFSRVEREAFVASCIERLRTIAPDAVVGIFRTAHVVFLLMIHPKSPSRLRNAAREASSRWNPKFITGTLFEPADSLPASAVEEVGAVAAVDETIQKTPALVPAPPADESPPADGEQPEPEPRRPSLLRRLVALFR